MFPTIRYIEAAPRVRHRGARPALEAALLCLGSTVPALGESEQVAASEPETITVTGQADRSETGLAKLPDRLQDTPQSVDTVDDRTLQAQSVTRLQDALRYVPGVTLNSGEGGAHGDTVNLRGLTVTDDFFVDGIRDPGSYTRDNFNVESIQVLQGPAATLFGTGQAGGAINQVTRQPSLTPQRSVTLEFGTNGETRGTADMNQKLGDTSAFRFDLMGEQAAVTGRDDVEQRRWGLAPSVTLGIHEPTTLTLSWFFQAEDNVPDYGIPFLWGQPAAVPHNLYYGLKDDDRTQTEVNRLTAELSHVFADGLSVTDTLRYGNYWTDWRVTAPHFGDDEVGGAPAPGTPLDQIVVYRDRPSSEGTLTSLTNHIDAIGAFAVAGLANRVLAGVEFGRLTNDLVRFNNDTQGIDAIPPTPLLAPDASEPAPLQQAIDARPSTTADMVGVYAMDTLQLAPEWSLNLGLRFDRFATQYDEPLSGLHYRRTDTGWSPRLALSWKPADADTLYLSHATSFDPPVSYLTLAPDSNGPAPETATNWEIGAKTGWLGGRLTANASLFRTDTANVLIADPDDPTLQQRPGQRQRIDGTELAVNGYLMPDWEIAANLTYIVPRITRSSVPAEVGKQLPGAARANANLWTTYEFNDDWQVGTGLNFLGHRYADTLNTANIPSYVVWNAMVAWQAADALRLQVNGKNLTNEPYFDGAYYSDPTENHVVPGAGRTITVTLKYDF